MKKMNYVADLERQIAETMEVIEVRVRFKHILGISDYLCKCASVQLQTTYLLSCLHAITSDTYEFCRPHHAANSCCAFLFLTMSSVVGICLHASLPESVGVRLCLLGLGGLLS